MATPKIIKSASRRLKVALGLQRAPSDLSEKVRAEGLTYLNSSKIVRIESALKDLESRRIPGAIAEFGVALGGSAVLFASAAKAQNRVFHGFDVFATIPEPTSDKDDAASKARYSVIASGKSEGINGATYYGYLDDLYERVSNTLARYGTPLAPGKVVLHKGLFEETVPRVDLAPLALAHLDCDWYDPVAYCLAEADSALVPGGVIILDDYYDYGGCKTATDEFISAHPNYEFLDGRNPILRKRS